MPVPVVHIRVVRMSVPDPFAGAVEASSLHKAGKSCGKPLYARGLPRLRRLGAGLQSLRVTCQKKYRLIEECDAASLHLWHLESSVTVIETPGTQRERLKRRAEEARRTSAEAIADLQTHRLLHGC